MDRLMRSAMVEEQQRHSDIRSKVMADIHIHIQHHIHGSWAVIVFVIFTALQIKMLHVAYW